MTPSPPTSESPAIQRLGAPASGRGREVRAIPWLLVAILAALVMWGYHHPRTIHVPGPTPPSVAMWAMRVS